MPIMLRDYVHIMVDRRGVADFYGDEDIEATMRQVVPIARFLLAGPLVEIEDVEPFLGLDHKEPLR